MDDEDVAARHALDALAHAVAEQALDRPQLARPDDDQIGVVPKRDLDDRLRDVADRLDELDLVAQLLQPTSGPTELACLPCVRTRVPDDARARRS